MEHKLQISVTHKDKHWFSTQKGPEIIQTKPFKIGLLIRNIGSEPMNGFQVSKIKWSAQNGQNIFEYFNKSFHIDTLNPDEERVIWVGKTGTYSHGLHSVDLKITPDIATDVIKTFQFNVFTNDVIPTHHNNEWLDFFFIRSKSEYEQSEANKLLLWLTIGLFIITFFNVYIFWVYQIKPSIDKQNLENIRIQHACQENLNMQLQLNDGTLITCEKYLGMLGVSTTTKK